MASAWADSWGLAWGGSWTAGSGPPPTPPAPVQTVGGKPRNYKRHYVELDGELFAVESEEEALRILEEAQRQAQVTAEAAATQAIPVRKAPAAPKMTLQAPEPSPFAHRLQAQLDASNAKIQAIYAEEWERALIQADDDEIMEIVKLLDV